MTARLKPMVTSAVLLTLGMAAGLGRTSRAQEPVSGSGALPDVYSQDDLMVMEKKLEAKTDAAGLATETLKKYFTDYTLLAFRRQSGKAELHEKFADFYLVVDGHATLVAGGHMVNGATTAPGEVRGDSIQDGKETKLNKGDVIHIPANIPHQLLLSKGDTFKYFVVKVQEVN